MKHTAEDIIETLDMINQYRLDMRTVTLGINLLSCADPDIHVMADNIYSKVTQFAGNLVAVCEEIETELGVPIVNKRISVTPISLLASVSDGDPVLIARALDRAAKAVGVNFIGGYSALVEKGVTDGDRRLIESIPRALKETDVVCSSVNVGTSRAGLNMDAVKLMGEVIKESAELTAESGGLGAAKLVVFANSCGDNPFMAGAFHGIEEPECEINVGISGPGVVDHAVKQLPEASLTELSEAIKRSAFKITRMGQLVGTMAAERLGVPFGIVDLSLAPTAELGDSVAHILENMGLGMVGTHGTTAALALLNDAVKKGGLMACSRVGGLSGSFIPVSEDKGMIDAVRAGGISLDKLEAMTAICSVGLDMVAVPGDTPATTLSGMIADEAAIGIMNHKTTAVRVIPVPGKTVGEEVNFGGLLGYAPVMPVHEASSATFINRGGSIPAPVHGFKN